MATVTSTTAFPVLNGNGNSQNLASILDASSNYDFVHAVAKSDGTVIDPATADLQSSVQSSAGTAASAAVGVQGITGGISVPVTLDNTSSAGTSATDVLTVQGASGAVEIPVSLSITSSAGTSASDILTVQGSESGVSIPASLTSEGTAGTSNSTVVSIQGNDSGVDVGVDITEKSAGGSLTDYRAWSAATVNSTSVTSTASMIYSGFIENFNSSAIYLKFYDSASAPTVGTDTPKLTIKISAESSFSFNDIIGSSGGIYFASGIGYGITGSYADDDTTTITADTALLQFSYK